MKKYKLSFLFILVSLLNPKTRIWAEEPAPLSDGPQVLDSSNAPPTKTEVETLDEPQKTEAISTKPETTEATVDLPLNPVETVEKNDKKLKPTTSNKDLNDTVFSEEDLLKPAKKSPPKVISKKINESEIYIQEASKYKIDEKFKSLKLNDVIEQGIRKNYDQEIRKQNEVLTDLNFDSAKRTFWYPDVKLVLSTNNQLISLLRKSSRAQTANAPTIPTGYLGLSIGDYTLFNWGKDYALYLNTKTTYERNKQIYSEAKRELKLDLITNYFDLITTKNIEKIRQDQLRHASFVYRLNKEKITIGKTSQQDYYQARNEYLRAQSDFHDAKMKSDIADESMSYLIADPVGTKYVLNEALDYRRIKISLEDSINFAAKQNPTLLNNQANIANAERSYDVAQKENLPLPKFSMNLGAYNKKFGPTTNSTVYETYSGNGNIELIASVNATWDLSGPDGLFNSSKLAKGRINKELATFELTKNKHFTESSVEETYKNIISYQNQMLILEARIPSVQKTFDIVLENYLSGKAKFNDFHLALLDLSETKTYYENLKLSHLKAKISLAKLLGMEDFPGENFEHLAQRIKGK